MNIDDYYLIVKENGTARLTKNLENCRGNDLLIELSIEIPDVLFERTRYQASIEVDENDVNQVEVPTATKVENAMRQAGLNINLSVAPKADGK